MVSPITNSAPMAGRRRLSGAAGGLLVQDGLHTRGGDDVALHVQEPIAGTLMSQVASD